MSELCSDLGPIGIPVMQDSQDVTGMRWTALPDKNTDQIGENVLNMCQRFVLAGVFGQFSRNFSERNCPRKYFKSIRKTV